MTALVVLALWMLVTVYQAWAWGRAMRRVEAAIASLRQQNPPQEVSEDWGCVVTEKDITAEQVAEVRALLARCIGGGKGFQWGDAGPLASVDEVAGLLARVALKSLKHPGDTSLWSVHVEHEGESLTVCHTGNGPTSEAHARFFAVAPWAIDRLAAALDAERAAHAETRRLMASRVEQVTAAERAFIDLRRQSAEIIHVSESRLAALIAATELLVDELDLADDDELCAAISAAKGGGQP